MFFMNFLQNQKLVSIHILVQLQYCKNLKEIRYRNCMYLLFPTNVDSYTIFDHQIHNRVSPDFSPCIKNIIYL